MKVTYNPYHNYFSWKRIHSTESQPIEDKWQNIDSLDSDHLRILSSSSFRRLQDKTQLFPLEKNDYARTRLTHSCEVAATAKAIGDYVLKRMKRENYRYFDTFRRVGDVAYLSALLHDIGNPPFGHYGEEVIRNYFSKKWDKITYLWNGETKMLKDLFPVGSQEYWDFCGFDGNAQALRVVTKLERYGEDPMGLNLTMAVLSGIIKYPFDSKTAVDRFRKHKFGYFKSESNIVKCLKDASLFFDGARSAIAYLVEAADDISMTISDFEDGVKKGCISIRDIEGYRRQRRKEVTLFRKRFSEYYQRNAKNQTEEPMISTSIRVLNALRNDLLRDVADAFVKMVTQWDLPFPQSHLGKMKAPVSLIESSPRFPIVKMLNDIVGDKVYQDEQIVAPELKGETILMTLLDKMLDAVLNLPTPELCSAKAKDPRLKVIKLMSKNYIDDFLQEQSATPFFEDDNEKREVYLKLRLVIDDISGMTDSYAEQLYNRIV